jgi:hypothetical protein
MNNKPAETLELRLTDMQIQAIQQRIQRRKRLLEEAARDSVQEAGIVELACLDE